MISGRERQFIFYCIRACRKSQRTFSGDMHRIGCKFFNSSRNFLPRKEGEGDIRVGWARDRFKSTWRNHFHLVTHANELFTGLLKGSNNAINLWIPCIGDDHNFHSTASLMSASTAGWKVISGVAFTGSPLIWVQ